MSKSIILCEGSTDYVLLQYYMQKVHSWNDYSSGKYKYKNQKSRLLVKNDDFLTIAPSGGCSQLTSELKDVLTRNVFASPEELFEKIVIITDNDDLNERTEMLLSISNVIKEFDCSISKIENNLWFTFSINRTISPNVQKCCILPLIIPFEENGAMETFLLNAISDSNEYDRQIIEKSKTFVDDISKIHNPVDNEDYLKHRRNKTKAKFDVYFSIRTPAEQFNKRRDIIKGVPWENYASIQKSFSELAKI